MTTQETITWEEAADNGLVNCILNDHHGIYIPQKFATDFEGWYGCEESDLEILRAGPDHEYYWDAWDDVMESARFSNEDGIWYLYADGDLFAINLDADIDWDSHV